MDAAQVAEKIITHETQIASMERRLQTCEETARALNTLAQSIAKMDVTLTSTTDSIKELKKDVVALKDVPSKRWDTIIATAITAIVGAVIGFILSGSL